MDSAESVGIVRLLLELRSSQFKRYTVSRKPIMFETNLIQKPVMVSIFSNSMDQSSGADVVGDWENRTLQTGIGRIFGGGCLNKLERDSHTLISRRIIDIIDFCFRRTRSWQG